MKPSRDPIANLRADLLDLARPLVDVRDESQWHPYGSTSVKERLTTATLRQTRVRLHIDYDTDLRPQIDAELFDGLTLRFTLDYVYGYRVNRQWRWLSSWNVEVVNG